MNTKYNSFLAVTVTVLAVMIPIDGIVRAIIFTKVNILLGNYSLYFQLLLSIVVGRIIYKTLKADNHIYLSKNTFFLTTLILIFFANVISNLNWGYWVRFLSRPINFTTSEILLVVLLVASLLSFRTLSSVKFAKGNTRYLETMLSAISLMLVLIFSQANMDFWIMIGKDIGILKSVFSISKVYLLPRVIVFVFITIILLKFSNNKVHKNKYFATTLMLSGIYLIFESSISLFVPLSIFIKPNSNYFLNFQKLFFYTQNVLWVIYVSSGLLLLSIGIYMTKKLLRQQKH